MTTALIDGDLILYAACHAVQARMYIAYDQEGKPYACSPRKRELDEGATVEFHTMVDEDSYASGCEIIDEKLKAIYKATECTEHTIYLTGRDNFRHEIYDEYKSHRPEKPIMHKALSLYMLDFVDTVMVHGQEADDAMGIAQTDDTIICSYDKDMLMIPGKHYQFNKDKFIDVTEEEGTRAFYTQLLTGDRVDNIPGLHRVGPKTAEKMLSECTTEEEMYAAVYEAYDQHMHPASVQEVVDMITRNARLLYIRREEDELWSPPSTTVT